MPPLTPNAKKLRADMTDAERVLWRELRAQRFGDWKFRRQQPIGRYIVDFVCFSAKCVIEADGGQHQNSASDAERNAWLQREGYTVLRYWNHQILTQVPDVLEDIERALRRAPSPQPLSPPGRGAFERQPPREAGAERSKRAQIPGGEEQRIHGRNACLALFARRPEAVRKVWLIEARIAEFKPVLAWCVKHRLGYRVAGEEDLAKLTGSAHHEGVCFDALRLPESSLSTWLHALHADPALALWLDGVGNPHNLGAILRCAAHFGAAALLLPKDSPLALSGAAARVAEGGAEAVPLVRLGRGDNAIAQLRAAGFTLAATTVRGGGSVFDAALPPRLVLVVGAEAVGVDPALAAACGVTLGIPGSGAVESLNVAAAAAVFLAEWRRRFPI